MGRFALLFFGFTARLLIPDLAQGHTGALAMAYPVENIDLDGSFTDWPEGLPRSSDWRDLDGAA